MIQASQITETLPRTLEEFIDWEPNDGFKYEWNDGEIIQFTGMKQAQFYIYDILLELFFDKGYKKSHSMIAEPDVELTGIQMRRPDIAFYTKEQVKKGRKEETVIPAFAIEIISSNDQINQMEKKLVEYFKAGMQVVWVVIPSQRIVYVHSYSNRREVKLCLGSDVCSAAPVLPDFEIQVDALLASPEE